MEDSVPFFFPIGERTASTISASDSQLGIDYRVEAPGPYALRSCSRGPRTRFQSQRRDP
jgi:hypothetical protein